MKPNAWSPSFSTGLKRIQRRKTSQPAPQVSIETSDAAVKSAAADVIAGGEVTGKTFETTLVHIPAKLKAKRLLLLGGGKAKSRFPVSNCAGLPALPCARSKPKGLRSFAFLAPESGLKAEDAVKAIVEGAFVGNFDPDYYKSDRKDQKIDTLTIVARGDQARLQAGDGRSPHHRRIAELRSRPGQRTLATA